MTALQRDSRIFVAGHRGMVGSAIARRLAGEGHVNVITRTRQELDLLDQRAVDTFFRSENIEFVFLAAARVVVSRVDDALDLVLRPRRLVATLRP